jgi:metal-sulfur cluster biosynthetic enzyme
MDPEMRERIDAILARVQEPETLRSVGELGLVKRVRYSPGLTLFEISLDIANPRSTCFVCGVVTATIQRSIERDLQEAFAQEFPGCRVQFS